MSIPSPKNDTEIFKLTDEGIAEYVEFPSDTIFLESIASNATYKQGTAYVAAQRTTGPNHQPESYVYTIRPGMTEAELLVGPLAPPGGGGTAVSIFGSALTSKGLLYLCCFNRNSLLLYDVENLPSQAPYVPILEIPDLPSPNDMCIDPSDENSLYVCGGTFRKTAFGHCTGAKTFTNSAYGQVFNVVVEEDKSSAEVTSIADGLDVLAGIEVVGDNIWVAQLYDILTIKKGTFEKTTRWVGDTPDGKNVWLADNIDIFEGDFILSPAYTVVSKLSVDFVMKKNVFMGSVLFLYQLQTACSKGEKLADALKDPEVSLGLSNTFIKEGEPAPPIKIVMMTPDGEKAYHFEIDLVTTREQHQPWEVTDAKTGEVLGKRHYFNDQVTHSSHLKTEDGSQGYIVNVSFEVPRILLLKDDKFKECIAKKG